jgi:hypothetical protein
MKNEVWQSMQSQNGWFKHLNDRHFHKQALITISSASKPRPRSGSHYRNLNNLGLSYGTLMNESVRNSLESHHYLADRNPQQVYLRNGVDSETIVRPQTSRHFSSKTFMYKKHEAKLENDLLLKKMCNILLRQNEHQLCSNERYRN